MPLPTGLTFTISFDQDVNSATYGFFICTDTTDYAAQGIANSDVIGFWSATYPSGSRTGSFATPDYDGGTSFVFNTLALPVDILGDVMSGTYVFTMNVRVSGGVQAGDYVTSSFSYDTTTLFSQIPTTVSISASNDCYQGVLSITNSTSYGVWTASSRELSVYPPPSLSLPTYTVAAASLEYAFGYSNAYYEITVNDLLTYSSGIFSFTYRVEGSDTTFINCDINLCNLYACINAYLNMVRSNAASYGGIKNISNQVIAGNVTNLFMYYIQFQNAVRCSQYDTATTYYNQIAAIVSASGCNCGCSEGTSPTVFTPISQVNNTVIVNGVSPIQVTSVTVGSTTTYTVTTTAAFNATFTQYGTDITTLQGDVTLIQAQIVTIQAQIAALQVNELNQVVDYAVPANVPAGGVFTTMTSYTWQAGDLEEGAEIHGQANFRTVAGSGTKDYRVLVNATTVLQLSSAAFTAIGEQLYVSVKIMIGETSGGNTALCPYITMKWCSSALPNTTYEEKVFSTTFTVPTLALNTLLVAIQASDTLALNTGMNLNGFKQFNVV